jgi:hypothetical protein
MLGLLRTGWRAVPASRHPHLMSAGWESPIVIKGLMLMEMPATTVGEHKKVEHREVVQQVLNSEAALREAPNNTAPRDHPLLPNESRHDNRNLLYGPGQP